MSEPIAEHDETKKTTLGKTHRRTYGRYAALSLLTSILPPVLTGAAPAASVEVARNYFNQVPAPLDYHLYTAQELAGLFERPRSVAQLIHNLQIVWARNLLAQPLFFDETNLTKVFNATKVIWQVDGVFQAPGYLNRYGTVTLDTTIFGDVTARVAWTHHASLAQRTSETMGGMPAYVEDEGTILMDVGKQADFTWGAVKAAFGPLATDQGDDTNFEGFPPPNYVPEGKAWMRYLHAGEDPTRFGNAIRPQAVFVIKTDAVLDPSDSRVPRHPKDTDEVKSLRLFDLITQYVAD
jgi:hypothetical protein